MYKVGDKLKIKSLEALIKEGLLKNTKPGVYVNEETKFVVFEDFAFFDREVTVESVDDADPQVPYFCDLGVWVPEFMVEVNKNKKKEKEEKVDIKEANPKIEGGAYINKFNNKPFGALFMKLIKLDDKIAEFSSNKFSELKKHELQYIAKLLMDKGAAKIDIANDVKELATYCFKETIAL